MNFRIFGLILLGVAFVFMEVSHGDITQATTPSPPTTKSSSKSFLWNAFSIVKETAKTLFAPVEKLTEFFLKSSSKDEKMAEVLMRILKKMDLKSKEMNPNEFKTNYEQGQTDMVLLHIAIPILQNVFSTLWETNIVNLTDSLRNVSVLFTARRDINIYPTVNALKKYYNQSEVTLVKVNLEKLKNVVSISIPNPDNYLNITEDITRLWSWFSGTTNSDERLLGEHLVDAFRVVHWLLVKNDSDKEKEIVNFFFDECKKYISNQEIWNKMIQLFKLCQSIIETYKDHKPENGSSPEKAKSHNQNACDTMKKIVMLFDRINAKEESDADIGHILEIFYTFFPVVQGNVADQKFINAINEVVKRMEIH